MITSIAGEFVISTTWSTDARGGKRLRPGTCGTLIRARSKVTACSRTSFSPLSIDNPKVLAARGLRISASRRQVSPCWAKTDARLTDSMVLPSPAVDETMRITKLDCFAFASRIEDFKLRTASACGDQGLAKTKTTLRLCAGSALTGRQSIGLGNPNRFCSIESIKRTKDIDD